MSIPAILLAAGASRRLGTPKQLIEVHGETLLNRTVRLAREAGARPVVAVLGAHCAEIAATLPQDQAVVVENDAWPSGMASSIRAGLRALEVHAGTAPGVLLLACDQPRLTSAHLRRLLDAWRETEGCIAASAYGGARGTPAIFPRALFPQLNALQGDKGARSILARPHCPLVEVEFAGGEVDIDLPGDLERLS